MTQLWPWTLERLMVESWPCKACRQTLAEHVEYQGHLWCSEAALIPAHGRPGSPSNQYFQPAPLAGLFGTSDP